MKTLTLMRHAKSSWGDPALADFDRPLNERGKVAAREMACRLREAGYRPDLIVASAAKRAVKTAGRFAKCYEDPVEIRRDPRLYDADIPAYLEVIRETAENVRDLLIVAHNPTIERFASLLAARSLTFPTAAYARFAVPEPWASFDALSHELLAYDFPKSRR
jgi:phosphohistidine phosphatase